MTRSIRIAFLALAGAVPAGAQAPSQQIPLGEAVTIRSAILDENRQLQVSLPESYERTTISYPVLFVLDGSSHLLHATATTRFLAAARNRIPEMIVVAIPNTNRNRDLTPGPGAARFQRFLAEELIPWVERTYRAAPERILFGHSLGGSFAVHTLLNRPDLFDVYVSVSAPLWRYEGLDSDMSAGLARAARTGATLYLAVGGDEWSQLREGVDRFAKALAAAPRQAAPAWSYLDLKGEDHSSTSQRALHDALEAHYAAWRFAYFENQAELDSVGGLKALEEHYEPFGKRLKYRSPMPEARLRQVARIYVGSGRHDDAVRLANAYAAPYPVAAEAIVNETGYDLLRRGEMERAVQAFKRNADAFPGSPNVFDSLGDAYCKAGEAELGRQSYQQAARVAESRSPTHPRLGWYRDKAARGCAQP